MGINRGPSMAYAILLALGTDPVEALDTLRGPGPSPTWYAEDALDWWHRRTGADTVRHSDRRRLAAWRAAHPLDVVRIIADRRRAGRADCTIAADSSPSSRGTGAGLPPTPNHINVSCPTQSAQSASDNERGSADPSERGLVRAVGRRHGPHGGR